MMMARFCGVSGMQGSGDEYQKSLCDGTVKGVTLECNRRFAASFAWGY